MQGHVITHKSLCHHGVFHNVRGLNLFVNREAAFHSGLPMGEEKLFNERLQLWIGTADVCMQENIQMCLHVVVCQEVLPVPDIQCELGELLDDQVT